MCPVAQRCVLCVLTAAEPNFGRGRSVVLDRRELAALMRAVTKRLLGGLAAAAPPIGLTGFDIDRYGRAARNDGFGHGSFLARG